MNLGYEKRLVIVIIFLGLAAGTLSVLRAIDMSKQAEMFQEMKRMEQQYEEQINILRNDELMISLAKSRVPEHEKILFPMHEDDFTHLTSAFGKRGAIIGGGFSDHKGLDISGIWKARIVAVKDGVIKAHWLSHPVYGKAIFIDHLDGTESAYYHLSESYIHERYNSGMPWVVKKGEVIGRMGNTGLSQLQHLHFVYSIKNEQVNPIFYIKIPENMVE